MKKLISTVSLCSLCLLFLVGCTPKRIQTKNKIYYEYFDTVAVIYDYSGSEVEDFAELSGRFEDELSEYHKLYDIYNEYDGVTNIATLNRLAGKGPVRVDGKIIDMLSFAKEMYEKTDGNLNIAMGAVLKIWHNYREEGKSIPTREELFSASLHTDINDLIIDKENSTVELLDPEMSLDVGGIGKGYAVEMIAKSMYDDGYRGYILDVGGNIRALGEKPDGTGFKTGVRNPDRNSSESYVAYFELKNQAAVTSGSYERFYTVDGVNYHHIINKDTLMPENYHLSVSVISNSSALSDALSTAFFNMETATLTEAVKSFSGIEVLLVEPNGEVIKISAN